MQCHTRPVCALGHRHSCITASVARISQGTQHRYGCVTSSTAPVAANPRSGRLVVHVAKPDTAAPAPHTKPHDDKKQILGLKMQLLAAVASLDRGLAANGREAREVDELCQALERLGGPVTLTWSPPGAGAAVNAPPAPIQPATLDMLAGTWRLVYTSGFNTGSLGGTRPGPPAALVPSILGQVYQHIDPTMGRLDNIVEFLFSAGVPMVTRMLSGLAGSPADRQYAESPALRLTLKHDYEIKAKNTVMIVYEDTSAELVGSSLFSSLPKFDFPSLPEALRPPQGIRSATFDVVYLDPGMRVTRGDRGELRVYLKDDAAAPALGERVPLQWSDAE